MLVHFIAQSASLAQMPLLFILQFSHAAIVILLHHELVRPHHIPLIEAGLNFREASIRMHWQMMSGGDTGRHLIMRM